MKAAIASPLKWHGGKSYLASKIVALMPLHVHYVEPFFGGGSVLLAKDPEGVSEVVNDLNGELTNFWRVLQSDCMFSQLCRVSQSTPFSEAEWRSTATDLVDYRSIPGYPGYRAGTDGSIWTCWKRKGHGWRYGTEPEQCSTWRKLKPYQSDRGYLRYTLVRDGEKRLVGGHILVLEAFVGIRPDNLEACHNDGNSGNNAISNLRWDSHSDNEKDKAKHKSEVWRAHRFFVKCRQSLAGRMSEFATLSRSRTRRSMNEQASAWLTAIDGLPEVHARLKRVVILNRDALDVIRQQDGPATLFYCDPPYLHETRATTGEYEHEMSKTDHTNLIGTLATIKGKFLLSGYRSESYDNAAENAKWNRHDFDICNNASGAKVKRRMLECVWANY